MGLKRIGNWISNTLNPILFYDSLTCSLKTPQMVLDDFDPVGSVQGNKNAVEEGVLVDFHLVVIID